MTEETQNVQMLARWSMEPLAVLHLLDASKQGWRLVEFPSEVHEERRKRR
jgi:hypothetical protein